MATITEKEAAEAKKLVEEKRWRRVELMDKGLTFEQAKIIVDAEYAKSCNCND